MLYKQKSVIRKETLEKRLKLTEKELTEKSALINDRLISLEEFQKAGLIMSYLDFKNEVMTGELISWCMERGKRVAVPKIMRSPEGLSYIAAIEIGHCTRDMEKCSFGIYEPKEGTGIEIDAQNIDLVIVPGVAFDLNKYRIGYGGGYYDRFLKNTKPDCFKAGVAFELQIFPELPVEQHDLPVDIIITEHRVIS